MLGLVASVLTVNTLLIGLVTGLFVYWLIQKFKYKLPPGPIALPLLGNTLQLNTNLGHEQIFEWSLKYGPVVSVYLGPVYTVFVNDLETAMEVLVKKGADFAGRVPLASRTLSKCQTSFNTASNHCLLLQKEQNVKGGKGPSGKQAVGINNGTVDAFTDGGKDIAFGQYGPTWKLHRRIASKALRHYMMGEALEERVHDAAVTVIDELTKQKEPIDPENYVNFIVGNILTGLCFGGKYTFDDPELKSIIKQDDDIVELAGSGILEDLVPGLKYVYETGKMKKFKAITKVIVEDYLTRKFLEHKESFNKDNIRDFTDTLILARQEAEEDPHETSVEQLSDTYLIQTLSDIFFAGIDTSRMTIRWALLHMAVYPEIQAKVQAEIDSVVGFDDLPRMSHRPNLAYTEAVLHESMRLGTVAPTGVFHRTMCDTSVGGYDIPKNTAVIINHWALHNDPKKWEDHDQFIPERYLDNDGKLGPKPENWLPFSAGRRVCLGEMVAKPELHLIFASLMQRFNWRLPDGEKGDLTAAGNMFALFPKPHLLIAEDRKPK